MTAPASTDIGLTYVGHATVAIELEGVRFLTDPLLLARVGPFRLPEPALDAARMPSPNAVLVSHGHLDHLHLPSLRQLDRSTSVLVPLGLRRRLVREGFRDVRELGPGDATEVGGVRVRATLAVHGGGCSCAAPAPLALGYVIGASRRVVYFAGDTDLFPGMATLADRLDVALLPVAGWSPRLGPGHLDPLRAAEALTLLRPTVAIPIHWGTLAPPGIGARRPAYLTQPGETFALHAARLAPQVEVRVLCPGDSTTIA